MSKINEIILVKIGEIVLKGLNRRNFESQLIRNIKQKIFPLGKFSINNMQSTISIIPDNFETDLNNVCNKIAKIFGIANFSCAAVCEKTLESIQQITCEYLCDKFNTISTFKVETKRADKKFPLKSPEISREVGGYILERFPHLKVNVHHPDLIVNIEIRDYHAFVLSENTQGAGGIPSGMGGIKAATLISGGIDSPVASFMMAKRGVELIAIHFASPPYTSPRAEDKVRRLLEKVSEYSGKITMITVPFTKIQEEIKQKSPEDLFTILMRRFMMRISEKVAQQYGALALITGESLGQVASQTLQAIGCTDNATSMPVFRPVIGMDKEEIVEIARKINTFDISIEPYEDCCTVFTPKHPKTKPRLNEVLDAENKLEVNALIDNAINNITVRAIG